MSVAAWALISPKFGKLSHPVAALGFRAQGLGLRDKGSGFRGLGGPPFQKRRKQGPLRHRVLRALGIDSCTRDVVDSAWTQIQNTS